MGACSINYTIHSLPTALYNVTYSASKVQFNWKVICIWSVWIFAVFYVVLGCSFLDSALLFWFLSKWYDFLASNLKPQAFLLNGTLVDIIYVHIWYSFCWYFKWSQKPWILIPYFQGHWVHLWCFLFLGYPSNMETNKML